jgi:hypothetical protein
VMMIVLPAHVREMYFPDAATFAATVIFLGFVLRLWTLAGELLLWGASVLLDVKGAMNRPDAPGRITETLAPQAQRAGN